MRHGDDMHRWSLPLLLAALLTLPGCVTVHPAPTGSADATAAADDKHPIAHRNAQRAPGAALPLSPLPAPAPASPAAPAPHPEPRPGHHQPAAAERPHSGEGRQTAPRRKTGPGTAPRRTAAPKRAPHPPAKPGTKARPKASMPRLPARPVPGTGAGDMRALCLAAHGVTSPAIAALCHQTYR
ncbi:hypothetical protein ACWGHM_41455 [Streptomyces sp. NPDC054904]